MLKAPTASQYWVKLTGILKLKKTATPPKQLSHILLSLVNVPKKHN